MERIASLVLMPSLLMSLLFGLASMAAVPGFHGAPWAWAKLVTTVLMLEGSLLGIQSPIKREAVLAEKALLDPVHISELAQNISSEQMSLVLIGLVATVNVALGVWRPKFRAKTTAST
jgi:disulfide bond formation protein DsbB